MFVALDKAYRLYDCRREATNDSGPNISVGAEEIEGEDDCRLELTSRFRRATYWFVIARFENDVSDMMRRCVQECCVTMSGWMVRDCV